MNLNCLASLPRSQDFLEILVHGETCKSFCYLLHLACICEGSTVNVILHYV